MYAGLWLTQVNDSTLAADTATISAYLLRRSDSTFYYPYRSNPLGYLTAANLSPYELLANKAIDFGVINNTKYPTTTAVVDYINGLGYVESVTGNIVDNTDPDNPVVDGVSQSQLDDSTSAIRADFPVIGDSTPIAFVSPVTGGYVDDTLVVELVDATAWQVLGRHIGTTGASSFNQIKAEHLNTTYSNGYLSKTNGSGVLSWGAPDSTTIPSLHSEAYYNTKYIVYSDSALITAKSPITAAYSGDTLYIGADTSTALTGLATKYQLGLKQNALTVTNIGSSGASTLVGSTLNIPIYSGGSSAPNLTDKTIGFGSAANLLTGNLAFKYDSATRTVVFNNRTIHASASSFDGVIQGNGGASLIFDGTNGLVLTTNLYNDGAYKYAASASGSYIGAQGGDISIGTAPTGVGAATATTTVRMIAKGSTGRIGFGIASPTYQTEVGGTGLATDGTRWSTTAYTSTPFPGSLSDAIVMNPRGWNLSADASTLSSPYRPGLGLAVMVGSSSPRTTPAASLANFSSSYQPALAIESGSMGIGTSAPVNSASLELAYTNKGFLTNRHTTTQMNAISSPATGLADFNTDYRNPMSYNGISWAPVHANHYIAKSATYTALVTDNIIECTANTFTLTLPTAVGFTGKEYTIVNSGAGTITIGTTSSQTFINVAATPTTLSIATVGTRTVVSNGANWILKVSL